jgi:hypothetical protein
VRNGTKIAAYTLVLLASCGAGAALGAAVGPDRDGGPARPDTEPTVAHDPHDE